jgi:hypothetical protein
METPEPIYGMWQGVDLRIFRYVRKSSSENLWQLLIVETVFVMKIKGLY